MARIVRRVRKFSADYDDATDTINIHTHVEEEVTTGRGREYQQGGLVDSQRNLLVLTRDEFAQLVSQGMGAMAYHLGLLHDQGVHIDPRTEKLVTPDANV